MPLAQHMAGKWAAYAAAGWAFAHAALSGFWAVGGTAGLGMLSEGIVALADAREAWFVGLVTGVAVAKALAGTLVLGLVRPWGRRLPRRLLRTVVALAGGAFCAYAIAGLLPGVLIALDVLELPADPDPAWRSYLLVWYPLWLLGGLLFLAAAWRAGRRRSPPSVARASPSAHSPGACSPSVAPRPRRVRTR